MTGETISLWCPACGAVQEQEGLAGAKTCSCGSWVLPTRPIWCPACGARGDIVMGRDPRAPGVIESMAAQLCGCGNAWSARLEDFDPGGRFTRRAQEQATRDALAGGGAAC